LWAAIFVTLIAAAFMLSFFHWITAAVVLFGVPEALGVWKQDDAYPPLTHVIVKYVHREIAFLVIYGLVGAVGAYWFGFVHPERLGAFAALLGWLTAHFDVYYDRRK
jgi:hypothetical protein